MKPILLKWVRYVDARFKIHNGSSEELKWVPLTKSLADSWLRALVNVTGACWRKERS